MSNILVIDDDEVLARAIQRMLKNKYDVTIENDPIRAVARMSGIDEECFDVVMCDCLMPRMNGFEVLRAARQHRNAPVFIMMSGIEHAVRDGFVADGILLKPFRADDARILISSLLEKRSKAVTQRVPVLRRA